MRAVRDGDVSQLGQLFERYHRQLYNYFLKLTGNRQNSEDLVQEVFWRILKYHSTYRGDGKFTTWLFQVARNTRIDYFRKNQRYTEQVELPKELFDSELNPDDRFSRQNEVAWLKIALTKLAPEKREVLVLSRFHGLKYEEIGKILNCKVGTIKARVFRALQELSEIYTELTGEPNEM